MTDGNHVTTIYATKVTGYRVREPGLVHIGLGLDGFEEEETETVARLALPVDTARSLATSLTEAVRIAKETSKDPEETKGRAAVTAVAGAGLFALRQLLSLVAADPAFADRLDQFERQILHNTRNMVTEGVSIHDEADAMGAAIEMLEKIFEQVRSERPDPDQADDAAD